LSPHKTVSTRTRKCVCVCVSPSLSLALCLPLLFPDLTSEPKWVFQILEPVFRTSTYLDEPITNPELGSEIPRPKFLQRWDLDCLPRPSFRTKMSPSYSRTYFPDLHLFCRTYHHTCTWLGDTASQVPSASETSIWGPAVGGVSVTRFRRSVRLVVLFFSLSFLVFSWVGFLRKGNQHFTKVFFFFNLIF
jgi:hypothetical protein